MEEIKKAVDSMGIEGITTNPSLIAKEKLPLKETIIEICEIVNGPVSAEVINTKSAEGIVQEALAIAKWHRYVVVKIPCTPEGLIAVRELSKRRIKTNVTLVFSVNQVLLAARAGATFISPFVGRLDDAGEDGMTMIEESLQVLRNHNFASQIIVASVRSPITVKRAAVLGAHIATVPFKILEQLVHHPLTDAGLKKFEEDWKNATK